MFPLERCESFRCAWKLQGEALKLLNMQGGKRLQSFGATVCEVQPYDAMIVEVTDACHQPSRVRAVHEADCAVVA